MKDGWMDEWGFFLERGGWRNIGGAVTMECLTSD